MLFAGNLGGFIIPWSVGIIAEARDIYTDMLLVSALLPALAILMAVAGSLVNRWHESLYH